MAENPLKKATDRKYWIFSLKIIGDFGVTLALPVVVFSSIGQRLDARFSSSPWFTVIGFALAAVLSAQLIYKKTKKYAKQYEDIDKK